MRKVEIGGQTVNAIGMGMWGMGSNPSEHDRQLEAVGSGLREGMQVLDTAEMYGSGSSEVFTGECVEEYGRRSFYIIDKVLPVNARPGRLEESLEKSLKLTRAGRIDLYLLHWRAGVDLSFFARSMHEYVREGLIGAWGVSNFDVSDLEDLWKVPYGGECATNEDLYNVATRGIDFDLLPWQRAHHLPLIAYSPLGSGGEAGLAAMNASKALQKVAAEHHATLQQVELSWAVRDGTTVAIPQSANPAHMADNAKGGSLALSEPDLALIDGDFPAPRKKVPLAKI